MQNFLSTLAYIWHAIQHFIYSDHKAEVFVGTAAAATSGYINSYQENLTHELFLRDVNTAVMAAIAAVIGFFVTMGLKKLFKKDE